MRKLILGLTLLSSISSFAALNSQDCGVLVGDYTCSFQGEEVDLSVSKSDEVNSIKLSIGGDGQDFILDGVLRDSTLDDSQNTAECVNDNEIVVDNFFKGELKDSLSVLKTDKGIEYTIIKESGASLSLNCSEK